MRIVFMGTPDFAVPVLDAAVQGGYTVVGVFTQPDKPVGRKQILTMPPVKEYALQAGIEVFQPRRVKRPQSVEQLKALAPDLILVAAYGQILSQEILDIPRYGCINLHASLLPKYRGAAPIQRCIVNGDTVTGVTAMQMNAGMDTGDMIEKIYVEIEETDTGETLHDKLSEAAGRLTGQVLARLAAGEELPREPQDDAQATMAPMLTKEDGAIDWNRPAKAVYDQVRGLYPWPGTYTFWKGQKLSVWETATTTLSAEGQVPGTVVCTKKQMYVACSDLLLEIRSLQLQGKKRMDSAAFLLGNHPNGDRLGAEEPTE